MRFRPICDKEYWSFMVYLQWIWYLVINEWQCEIGLYVFLHNKYKKTIKISINKERYHIKSCRKEKKTRKNTIQQMCYKNA